MNSPPKDSGSDLLPCPFCGCALVANTDVKDLYVRRYGTHWQHPQNDCHMSDHEVSPGDVEDWNRRAAPLLEGEGGPTRIPKGWRLVPEKLTPKMRDALLTCESGEFSVQEGWDYILASLNPPFAGIDPNFAPGSNPENPQPEDGASASSSLQLD